jgi:mitochondrial ornithine carrier protein
VELIKCKMQVQMLAPANSSGTITAPARLPGPISVLMSVIRTSGFRGLWLGQSGTFIRETGGSAAWFGTKEYVASLLIARRRKHSQDSGSSSQELLTWESALSGACAGVAFNFVLFPADTVKSAIQTEEELRPRGVGINTPKSTFMGTFRQMYKAQGIRGLYAGCGITIARSMVSSAMIFVIYDELNRRFG